MPRNDSGPSSSPKRGEGRTKSQLPSGANAPSRLARAQSLGIEWLEERVLLAVAPSLSGPLVTFTGDGSGNNLLLAVNAGQLEYSVDGGSTFSTDLDPSVAGTQSLTLSALMRINVNLGTGANSLSLDASLVSALGTQVAVDESGAAGGQVAFNGQSVLTFTDVPSIVENVLSTADGSSTPPSLSSSTLTLNSPSPSDFIHVADSGNGSSVVSSGNPSSPFPSVRFANTGLSALSLNPGGGNASSTSGDAAIAIDTLEPGFDAAVVVNAPDQVNLLNIHAPGGLTVNATTSITAGPAIADQRQAPVSNWTPNATYASVPQASTTGSGAGMTVSISVGANGQPVASLVNFGSGYDPGDFATFDPPNGVGTPIMVEVNTTPDVHQTTQPSAMEPWTPNSTFTNVLQASTTGSGTGMLATITVNAYGDPTVTVTNSGVGAQIGDTVAFDAPDGVGTPVTIQVQPVYGNPSSSSNSFTTWTPNQFWTTVPQSATSGIGTGMSAYVTVDSNGVPTANVHDVGVTIPDTWTPNQHLTNVAQASTTGSGTGMTATITVPSDGIHGDRRRRGIGIPDRRHGHVQPAGYDRHPRNLSGPAGPLSKPADECVHEVDR